jgi:hypothetical protein
LDLFLLALEQAFAPFAGVVAPELAAKAGDVRAIAPRTISDVNLLFMMNSLPNISVDL